ncbi:MAG: hypothetical protein U0414_35705 [Polyangiaceae bacterium]
MRTTLLVGVVGLVALVAGCSATSNRQAAEARAESRERAGQTAEPRRERGWDDDAPSDPFASDGKWSAPKRTIFETADTFNEEHTRARPVSAGRPKSKAHVDVDLKAANLADALRFLASAGNFNLVIEDNLGSPVTVDLHDVDPYDALCVIAESQGLEVEYTRGIVRVGSAKPVAAQPSP